MWFLWGFLMFFVCHIAMNVFLSFVKKYNRNKQGMDLFVLIGAVVFWIGALIFGLTVIGKTAAILVGNVIGFCTGYAHNKLNLRNKELEKKISQEKQTGNDTPISKPDSHVNNSDNKNNLALFRGIFFKLKEMGKTKLKYFFDPNCSVIKGDKTSLAAVAFFNECNENDENNLVALEYKTFDNYKFIIMYLDSPEKRVVTDHCHTIVLTLNMNNFEQNFYALIKTNETLGYISKWNEDNNHSIIRKQIPLTSTEIIKIVREELIGKNKIEPKNIPFTITSELKKEIVRLMNVAFTSDKLKRITNWDSDKINEFQNYLIENDGITRRYDKRFEGSFKVVFAVNTERALECLEYMKEIDEEEDDVLDINESFAQITSQENDESDEAEQSEEDNDKLIGFMDMPMNKKIFEEQQGQYPWFISSIYDSSRKSFHISKLKEGEMSWDETCMIIFGNIFGGYGIKKNLKQAYDMTIGFFDWAKAQMPTPNIKNEEYVSWLKQWGDMNILMGTIYSYQGEYIKAAYHFIIGLKTEMVNINMPYCDFIRYILKKLDTMPKEKVIYTGCGFSKDSPMGSLKGRMLIANKAIEIIPEMEGLNGEAIIAKGGRTGFYGYLVRKGSTSSTTGMVDIYETYIIDSQYNLMTAEIYFNGYFDSGVGGSVKIAKGFRIKPNSLMINHYNFC